MGTCKVDGTEKVDTAKAISLTTSEANTAILWTTTEALEENISFLRIVSRRELDFCVRGTTTRILRGSFAKVISGRISVRPKIKVITRWCYFRKECSQGLSGFSAAPLTSSAPLRDECRLSRVGLGYAFRPSGAAATDTPRLASSRYRLARLRADRTLPVHLCLIQLEMILSFFIDTNL